MIETLKLKIYEINIITKTYFKYFRKFYIEMFKTKYGEDIKDEFNRSWHLLTPRVSKNH